MVGALLLAVGFPCQLHAQVVINEIMANPEGTDTYTEYVELFNAGLLAVDLHDWLIANDNGEDTLRPKPDGVNMTLSAGGYAIILESGYGSDGNELYAGRIPDEALRLSVDDAAIGSGGLSNSVSQTVRLINRTGSTVSSRTYRPNPPGGVSEERIDPNGGEGDDNWAFSSQGGTPGYVNSVTPLPHDLALDTAYVGVAAGRDSLLTLTVHVRNFGTGVSQLGRLLHVHLADTLGATEVEDATEITALEVSEVLVTGWEFPRCPGGGYLLELWLTPPDDRPANDSLSLAVELPYPVGTLRIVEVMPDPPSMVDVEWVEIVNRSVHAVPLVQWVLSDASGTKGRIRSASSFLEPDSVMVLAADSLLLTWPGLPPGVIVLVPGSWPSLNNGGDT
ncbi:MAG: lamin tail domain-containing protein, partial [bacterium]